MKADFFDVANFPNVIGLADGTQVSIKAPSTDEHYMYAGRVVTQLSVHNSANARLKKFRYCI